MYLVTETHSLSWVMHPHVHVHVYGCVSACSQHWIRLEIQPNILLEQLAIQVSPLDASYMPVSVAVYGGQTIGGLKELKTCSIPSSAREFVLVSGLTEVVILARTVDLVPY